MKKGIILGITGAIVVALVATVFIMTSNNAITDRTPTRADFSSKVVEACSVLTPEIASEFLGETVENDDKQAPDASTEDILVSNCAYSTKYVVGKPDSLKSTGLLARSAKTLVGAESNQEAFEAQRPAGAEPVEGYGDVAFWNPYTAQLNILKNDNWYIVIAGSTTASNRTLDQAKVLADRLIDEL